MTKTFKGAAFIQQFGSFRGRLLNTERCIEVRYKIDTQFDTNFIDLHHKNYPNSTSTAYNLPFNKKIGES